MKDTRLIPPFYPGLLPSGLDRSSQTQASPVLYGVFSLQILVAVAAAPAGLGGPIHSACPYYEQPLPLFSFSPHSPLL